MDTKEKRREQPRQRTDAPERRKRSAPAQTEVRPEKQERPAKSSGVGTQARTAEKAAPEKRKEAPGKTDRPKAQQRPEHKRAERREESVRRTGERRQNPEGAARQRPARQEAPQTEPRRRQLQPEDGLRYSAPQGTGPRKSAPKMSPQEAEALRAKRSTQTHQGEPVKKNALQNFISGIRGSEPVNEDPAERAARRRRERAVQEEKKKQRELRHDTPAIIYTQPQVFNRDRLLLQLLTVTAVVAAMVIGMSLFFKVKTITVAGEETYSKTAVEEASGIKVGDNLLTFSKARASAQIRAKLHYVDNIRIGIKLPDTVIIYIEELDVAYAIESIDGDLWLINSDGRVVEQINNDRVGDYTKVEGVTLLDPTVGDQAIAADEVPTETLESGEPVPITVTGAQRLTSLLQILKALEANDIVGEAASLDVSELDDIRMWYGSRYEVLLGDTTKMEYKIACMNDAIMQMSDYQSGILDVSFTTWTDMIGYTPFG